VPPPADPVSGSNLARAVAAFHEAFGLPQRTRPTVAIGDDLARLRLDLMEEEFGELVRAVEARDLVAIADALADIVYVAYGTALTYGIDLDAVLDEVHRANMSKLGADGRPVLRDDGKVLRSERYSPPDVAAVVGRGSQLRDAGPVAGGEGGVVGVAAGGVGAAPQGEVDAGGGGAVDQAGEQQVPQVDRGE
jgi:predicted HAD superfamily Cof-like phosphohydrolase